jgi:hypothetical protein
MSPEREREIRHQLDGAYFSGDSDTYQAIRDLLSALDEARKERENLAVFIKRLVRKLYGFGHKSKLTSDAMGYINSIGAECSPLRKLVDRIYPEAVLKSRGDAPEAGK